MNNEEQEQRKPTIIEQKGKQLIRKKGAAVAKKAAKLAAKLAVKAAVALTKLLVSALAYIGGPVLLGIAAVGLLVLVIYMIVTLFYSNAPEALDEEALGLRNHIVAVADATVDMSRPEQVKYRVPHELIIAALQLYDSGEYGVSEKEAASIMAKTLAPLFTYEKYEGHIENVITTCVDGSCSTATEKIPFILEPLVYVEAWNVIMEATVTPYTTEWQTSTSSSTTYESREKTGPDGKVIPNEYEAVPVTTTVTRKSRSHTFLVDEVETEDYTYYDRVLSQEPFGYGLQDKLIVEAMYEVTGGYINYTGWLTGNSLIGFDGVVTPGAGVPLEFMEYYLAAEKKYKVDWYYIAAIHFVETGFSTHPTMISSVGAEGHTQFMPCTWLGWSYPACGGVGYADIPPSIKTDPFQIKKYGGLGVDGNGDGKADPWNVVDAIFSTANLLSKNGFSKNIDSAIRAYNHSDTYVTKVKNKAMELKNSSSYAAGDGKIPALAPGSFMRPAVGSISSKYGPRNLKNGFHYGADIQNSTGTPIVAMADGKVIKQYSGCTNNGSLLSKCGGGWGNHVYIEHVVGGHKFVAVYAHFSKTIATTGQTVKQGQVVGAMGASGSVTGVHLHIELHNGSYKRPQNVLNPALYIPL
ncbi:peptidoglycan DD-metalloendopeptidase family protein [Psychrobacillus sp. FSL K6-2684]|uniref:peptidoglycan DD-metalloendopeptidase family protein n=1 Tax=unclassified Psychrobacillus TaxID=2636677 RepID=UPI0030F650C8